jgi:seryl-tRNA synthetase
LEKDGKSLQDEVVTLKTAIEEAINKGQKSLASLNDIPEPDLVANKDFALTRTNAGSGVVGWVDDF